MSQTTSIENHPNVDRWITEVEAAELTGLSHFWFQRQRGLGSGPPYSKLSKAVRYKLSDLMAYMESRKVAGG